MHNISVHECSERVSDNYVHGIRSVQQRMHLLLFQIGPAFQQLLRDLLVTENSLQYLAEDISTQIACVEGFTSSTATGTQVEELQAFIAALTTSNASMADAENRAEILITSVQASSVSAEPYQSQSDKLGDNLLEAQTKTAEFLGKVAELADKGITRYAEIVFDINLQISAIENAGIDMTGPAITEAIDELNEAIPDASSQLSEVLKSVNEALEDLDLRVTALQEDLGSISSPDPVFTNFINQFIDGTATVAPAPDSTAAPATASTAAPTSTAEPPASTAAPAPAATVTPASTAEPPESTAAPAPSPTAAPTSTTEPPETTAAPALAPAATPASTAEPPESTAAPAPAPTAEPPVSTAEPVPETTAAPLIPSEGNKQFDQFTQLRLNYSLTNDVRTLSLEARHSSNERFESRLRFLVVENVKICTVHIN